MGDGVGVDDAVGGNEWDVFNKALRDQQSVEWVPVVMGHPLNGGDVRQRDRENVKAVAPRLVKYEWLNRLGEAKFAEATLDAHLPCANKADVDLVLRVLDGGQGRRAEFARRQQEPE